MKIFIIKIRHITSFIVIFVLVIATILIYKALTNKVYPAFKVDDEVESFIINSFELRNRAMVNQNKDTLKSLYDLSKRTGIWAYEHEYKKMKYLDMWSKKQGINFTLVKSNPIIRWSKKINNIYKINLLVSTTYKYKYINEPKKENLFRIGTYHYVELVKNGENFLILKEWYTDPFADSLRLDKIKSEKIKDYIINKKERQLSNLKRRKDAVKYADMFVGAADNGENNYSYNKKYKNYNPLGGDCANFASQILYEGGKFRKTSSWNYKKDGSKAWVNAHAFKNYMIYSGRASVIAYGSYEKVLKLSYKLQPGDFIAYEKKGKVKHISVVTGADSKGYTLVNCHNTDRYRVPWDLGWSDKNIKFWLVRVHY